MKISIEKTKNRDLLLKVAFMYFLSYILIILGIDEEIVELKPIEYVTMKRTNGLKIFNKFLDHCALTRSGKVILFEFKKDPICKKDLKQACEYSRIVYCKEKKGCDNNHHYNIENGQNGKVYSSGQNVPS